MRSSINIKFISIFTAVMLTVLIAIVGFFALIRSEIISLSMDRMSIIAESCTNNISRWADRILNELDIYKDIAEKEGGVMDEHTCGIISTSLGAHSEYPYGIYWADKNNSIHVTSGWYEDDYVPSERIWYSEGLGHIRFEFGEPYVDEFTGNPCVSATARARNGGIEGVMAADVYLDYVSSVVGELSTKEIERAFIVTKMSRTIVADSDPAMYLQVLGESDIPLYRSVNELLDRHVLGQTAVKVGGDLYYVNINQIDNTDWLFVSCINRSTLTGKLRRTEIIMFVIGMGVCLALILLAFLISRRMKADENKAKSDPLTGLLNRDGLKAVSVQAMENNPGQGVLLIMDMDNFKQINDQLGHPEGDEVLRGFAELLREYFNRNRDYSARLGGDEFAVYVGRQMEKESIALMLDKFMELFHKKYDEKYSGQQLSVSVGAAFVAGCAGNYDELYRRADSALYTAKENGKNTYAFENRF